MSNYLLNEAKKIGYDSTWDAVIYNGVDLGSFHPIVDDNKEVIKRVNGYRKSDWLCWEFSICKG